MTLEPLPYADLGIGSHADNITRRVRQRQNLTVVGKDAVGTCAGQQIPHADHSVLQGRVSHGRYARRPQSICIGPYLRPRSCRVVHCRVDKSARDWAAMAVKGEDIEVILEAKNPNGVIHRPSQNLAATNLEAIDWLLMGPN